MMKRTLFALGALLLLALVLLPTSRAFAASSRAQIPADSFSASCSGVVVDSGGDLNAICRAENGALVSTSLYLNPFIGNSNGTLVVPGADFVASCPNIGGGVILDANCRREDGTLNFTTLDLDRYVGNTNGRLTWG